MDLINWYKQRGIKFIARRAQKLLRRYGGSPYKAIKRNEDCVLELSRFGCFPTFAVPGLVVKHHPATIRRLHERGAEIAVHGYNHVDMRNISLQEANRQLLKAAKVFADHGFEAYGFRCPYLSASDEMLEDVPEGAFLYSSNKAVLWDIPGYGCIEENSVLYDTIRKFYRPTSALVMPSVPYRRPNLIEIPACVPDDLQLFDGLGLNLEQVAMAWVWLLRETYRRGELFNLMFHPELAANCNAPFVAVLEEAQQLQPKVWVARLAEIAGWWREKASFTTKIEQLPGGLQLRFDCTDRATILVRGVTDSISSKSWDGKYQRLEARELVLSDSIRPFIGISKDVDQTDVDFLEEQGYILDQSNQASQCSLYLNRERFEANPGRVALLEMIEASSVPLVRFGRWPDGYKSALSITGDLDALSLVDYAIRLF